MTCRTQFNLAFGEHTGISEQCREDIRRIKNNYNPLDDEDASFQLNTSCADLFTDLAWKLLGRYIANNMNLKELDLARCILSNERMALLFSELVRSSITYLYIRKNSFGVEGLRCMIPFLENSPNLSDINFSRNNNFNSECFEVLIKALRGNPVMYLCIRRCNITDISVLELYSLPKLSMLTLMGNNIGREGCTVLSHILQQEGSELWHLDLRNTDIDDEGAEILATALKHNINLDSLDLKENNINKKGRQAFLKILIDVSSIESMWNSNHKLRTLGLDTYDGTGFIQSALQINEENQSSAAGRAKIIKYQLKSQIRKKLCELQGVEYSADDNMLADIDPVLLPQILASIGSNHGQSELYTSLLPVAPDLMSVIDREAMIKDEKNRNAAQMAALTAEYEQKMAILTNRDDDLNSRLALIEFGDRKQAVVDGSDNKKGGVGRKRQRII